MTGCLSLGDLLKELKANYVSVGMQGIFSYEMTHTDWDNLIVSL